MENNKTTRESVPGDSRGVHPVSTHDSGIEKTEPVEVGVQPTEPQPVQRAEIEPNETSLEATDRFSGMESQMEGPLFVIWGPLLYRNVFQAILDFAKENTGIPRLNVVLETLGGNPDLAFNCIVTLRSSCNKMVKE